MHVILLVLVGVTAHAIARTGEAAFTHKIASLPSRRSPQRPILHHTSTATASPIRFVCSFNSIVNHHSSLSFPGVQLFESSGPGNVRRPQNEFSRRYRDELVIGPRRRDYSVSIKATKEEREALAQRFRLSHIAKLEADLTLRRGDNASGSARGKGESIYAEGTVVATVTQTCVRTSENFDVDLEFNFFSAIRPVSASRNSEIGGMDLTQIQKSISGGSGGSGRRRKGKRDGKFVRAPEQQLDEMGMKELQDLLEDFDVEEDVIEDEAVYSADGIIDLGELVAQTFRLKLDPYPKKPGTKPINISFTG